MYKDINDENCDNASVDDCFIPDKFTLLDENGNEVEFEVVGECVYKEKTYFALINPAECEDGEFDKYIIVREDKADSNCSYSFVEDDEEFEDVADIFDDMFTSEIDCDRL